MALLIADCPRCGAKSVTFDVSANVLRRIEYNWSDVQEVFAVCRHCNKPTIFVISLTKVDFKRSFTERNALIEYPGGLNQFYEVDAFISLKDHNKHPAPELLSDDLERAFDEGAACFTIGCYNASAAMFRLCVDIVTRPLLPESSDHDAVQPNEKQRRDLGLRLSWLFEQRRLDPALKELARCIREDANDGAHKGNLGKEDAEDVLEFTYTLLEKLVTQPEKLKRAEARRLERRKGST